MVATLSVADAAADLVVRRVQPTIGAEITGIDLAAPITDAQRDRIRAAVIEHKVVFFRDQVLDDNQLAAFAVRFGPLYSHPRARGDAAIPSIQAISAEKDRARKAIDHVLPGDAYHSDTSWRLVPTWGAVLRDVRLPDVGGDTVWVDAHLAYQGLDDAVKERLEGRFVTHDFQDALRSGGHDYPLVSHPVIRTHRETRDNILWVNYAQRPQILGVELAESRELLGEILRQYKRPEFQVRFAWQRNSVAFWDNRSTVHYAVRNYGDFPRELQRILIAEEPGEAEL